MLKLKFLTFKNLGSIARSRGDDSAALDAFIQVCTLSLSLYSNDIEQKCFDMNSRHMWRFNFSIPLYTFCGSLQ